MSALKLATALSLLIAAQAAPALSEEQVAIFSGGCFWCVESDFDAVKGVKETISGYIGGKFDNPTYQSHIAGGDREAVQIKFDSELVSYDELVKIFFRSVDPTDDGGQFCDRGHSYTTAIWPQNEEQAKIAMTGKEEAAKALGSEIATAIEGSAQFWPAEEYHQDYYIKNPWRYAYYRKGCGRDAAVARVWGDQARYGIADKTH